MMSAFLLENKFKIKKLHYGYSLVGDVFIASRECSSDEEKDALRQMVNLKAEEIKEGKHVALIVDNAGWHNANELIVPDNITLIPLPPYSPELNAMEQVWEWIKKRFLYNQCYSDYNDIVDKVCDAWNYPIE